MQRALIVRMMPTDVAVHLQAAAEEVVVPQGT